jgi:Class-II DAHP synthetase family
MPTNLLANRGATLNAAAHKKVRRNDESMTENWHPHSWRDHEARQLPHYADAAALAAAERELGNYPPLVFAGEARDLTRDLARVADFGSSCKWQWC